MSSFKDQLQTHIYNYNLSNFEERNAQKELYVKLIKTIKDLMVKLSKEGRNELTVVIPEQLCYTIGNPLDEFFPEFTMTLTQLCYYRNETQIFEKFVKIEW